MTEPNSATTPREALDHLVDALGSQSAAAKHIGVGRQYMSDLLNGRRGISGRIAKALGFKKRVVFELIDRR